MASDDSNNGLPIPYVTAVWSGMPLEDIKAGLAAGSILPPLGMPEGRLPAASGDIVPSPHDAQMHVDVPAADRMIETHAAAAGSEAKNAVDSDPRAQIAGWLQAIDPSLTTQAFDALWTHAGVDNDARAATLRQYLGETLIGRASASADDIDAFVADPKHRAQVVDLTGLTGSDISELAKTDVGYRHALATMRPFALTGNRELFARANAAGALDRFDPDTGEQMMSDAWLGDRAKLLAWKSTAGDSATISGDQDWTFIDHTRAEKNGTPARLELRTGTENAGQNQVVFGNESAQLLEGVSGSDRIYAGAGNDIVRGAAGADHLEAGMGNDLLLGGGGNDDLVGDQGDDELDGGRGNDRLTAGSGSDMLIGGRGNDRLEGGIDRDFYVIDEGDGADTIVDADGLGAIELEGVEIGGTMVAGQDGTWTSLDGRLSFAMAGGGDGPGTLTITGLAPGGSAPAMSNVITVQNWKNGDLGITLGDAPDQIAAGGPNYDLQAVTGPEVPLVSVEDVQPDASGGELFNDPSGFEEVNVDDDIGWGDVGPVGAGTGTSVGHSPESSALIATDADIPIGPVQADVLQTGSIAPDLGSLQNDEDFSAELDALFAGDASADSMLQPSDVANAIDVFSGVLEVPDVPVGVAEGVGSTAFGDALTPYDYADAMSGEPGEAELGGETGLRVDLSMPVLPYVRNSEVVTAAHSSTAR